MCSSNALFSVLGAFETEIQKLTGLKTASVFIGGLAAVVVNGNSDALFQKHFPWSATHFGTAVAHMAISLPIGVDGSSFRVHAQIDSVIGWRLMATGEGTAYTYRARNNNGRQFTVHTGLREQNCRWCSFQSRCCCNSGGSSSRYRKWCCRIGGGRLGCRDLESRHVLQRQTVPRCWCWSGACCRHHQS